MSAVKMTSGLGKADSSSKQGMIKPGTLLLKCDPLVYVGHLAPPVLCDTCLTMETAVDYKLKRCSFCRVVYYCNAECQRKGWKDGHKYECVHMMALLVVVPLSHKLNWMPRLLLRLILKLQDGKDYYDELVIGGTKIKRRFEDLMSKLDSEEARQCKDGMFALDIMIRTVKHMLRDKPKIKVPNDTQLHKMSGQIMGNVIEIGNMAFCRVGSGVYLGGSILDHSCKAMAVPTFEGTTMYVRNIMEIPNSLPISKVTISYLYNTLMPTEERRKMLKDKWYFRCECEMCETGEMDKEIRSIICPSKRCSAEIDSLDIGDPCHSCGHVMRKDTVAKVLETEADARKLLKADDCDLESIEAFIASLKKNHFSDKHWLMLRFYDEAMKKASSLGTETEKQEYWKKTYIYASKYMEVARRFFHPNEIELIRVLLELALSSAGLSKFDEVEKCLIEAKSIAEVVFGKDSDFVKSQIDEGFETLAEARALYKMRKLRLETSKIKA